MNPNSTLPDRKLVIRHVLSSLNNYWTNDSECLFSLPIINLQSSLTLTIPLRLEKVTIPVWASVCGINGEILVPQECILNNSVKDRWKEVDWWAAAFLLMEGWHERLWETTHGVIHSYSRKLKGWDTRAWDHAWVNRIAMFLRKWLAMLEGKPECFLGKLPTTNIVLSHDVDAITKTHPIRIKQTIFLLFNSLLLCLQFKFNDSLKKLVKSFQFCFSNEDWWVFDKLLKINKEAGISALYHFYADPRPKTFKRWLMDPSYNVSCDRVCSLVSTLMKAGNEVGLHPTYDAWYDYRLIEEQRVKLENCVNSKVSICRQHWLRFSWKDTWFAQEKAGLDNDSSLMFNDRSGFRNSSAISWKPWNQLKGESYNLICTPCTMMDSHLYDYNNFTSNERSTYMKSWIKECREVKGKTSLLWHPQTLTDDYGWEESFIELVDEIS